MTYSCRWCAYAAPDLAAILAHQRDGPCAATREDYRAWLLCRRLAGWGPR